MKKIMHASELYFSGRLREKLDQAAQTRGLVIEAPSGYGKTTAVQNYLRKILPKGTNWIRHVCAGESAPAAWRRFAQALRRIDPPTGDALRALGLPDKDTVGDAETLLREMNCRTATWLVIDDFHQIAPLAPLSLWRALLEHEARRLRVVFVTRPLDEGLMRYEKGGFFYLDENDLRLSERECGEFFATAGFPLTKAGTHELHRRTSGWIIALVLHLKHYVRHSEFVPASTLDELLRDVVWNVLSEDERACLLALSPFDAFTAEQAASLAGGLEGGGKALRVLARKAIILRFDHASGLYYPHDALLKFLRQIFAGQPEDARRRWLEAAGGWCAANGERGKAIAFYYRLRDFEKILALDLSGLEDNSLMDLPGHAYVDALRDIAAHCTREMKLRHPMSAIQIAFEFFGQGCPDDFARLRSEMEGLVGQCELPEEDINRLRGELLLMEAFTYYNRIAEMGKRMRRAAELTNGATTLILPENSWTFGNVSVLFMYHRDAGQLDRELADMEYYTPYYTALAAGHGRGGPALMRAEALLFRGETEEAEILGHKARHEANLAGQISILIGAELLLGCLAILRGDAAALFAALENIDALAENHPQKSNRMEADLARAFLAGLRERPREIPEWLRDSSPPAHVFSRRLFL